MGQIFTIASGRVVEYCAKQNATPVWRQWIHYGYVYGGGSMWTDISFISLSNDSSSSFKFASCLGLEVPEVIETNVFIICIDSIAKIVFHRILRSLSVVYWCRESTSNDVTKLALEMLHFEKHWLLFSAVIYMQFWRNNLVVFQSFHEEFDVSFIFKGIGTDGAGDSTLSTALSFFCLLTAWEWTVIGFTHNYRNWRVVLQYIVLQKVRFHCYIPDFKCSFLCVKIPREFTDWQLYKGSLNLYFSYVWLNLCLATLSRPFCSTIEFFTKFGPMPINVLQSRDRRATTLCEWYDRWAKKNVGQSHQEKFATWFWWKIITGNYRQLWLPN